MKLHAPLIVLLTGLLFLTPVWSQEVTPELFTTKVAEWIEADDLVKVAQAVRYQREAGRAAFDRLLQVHKTGPSDVTERWLNTVARAFRMEGLAGPNQTLSELGILWPNTRWRGTVFEDDQVVDRRGTIAENVPNNPEDGKDSFLAALAATHLAVRVGNDFALPSMLSALKNYLREHPEHPRRGEVLALEVSALETTGLWREAYELGETYASKVTGADALALHLSMLNSARKLEQPLLVDKQIAQLDSLLEQSDSPLIRFAVESVRFERDCQQREVPLEELTRRHVATWRNLRTDVLESIPGGLGRQLVEAAGVWIRESLKRMQAESDEFPSRAQLYYIVWEDLRKLRRLSKNQLALRLNPSKAEAFFRLWNPEFLLATQALELEVVSSWRRHGQTDHARVLLSELEGSVQETWENMKEAGLAYQLGHYGNPIKLGDGEFEFVWTLGEAPRMVALQRIERAHLQNDFNAVEEAIVYQKDARTQGGFLGSEDARFLKVENLIEQQKAFQAGELNRQLLKTSREYQYRPGQIICLVNDAEISRQEGREDSARSSVENAVKLIEEYLTEAGGQAAVPSRFRRAYELLAELQLEAGLDQEAFQTLARLGQAESVMALNTGQFASRNPKLKKLVGEMERTRARTRALSEARGNQARAGRDTQKTEGEIANSRSEFYRALGDIRRNYPGYGQMLAVRPVNFARLQKFVPPDTAVVQIFPARDALFLFLLTRDELKIEKVPVSHDQIEELARSARTGLLQSKHRSLRDRAGRVVMRSKKESTAEGSLDAFVELHDYLVKPIAHELEAYEVVAFIPSGTLMNVPLQALATKDGESLRFLIEDKQVVTLLKSTDLERLAREPELTAEGTLVVGNPDGTLPGAATEARSIAGLFTDAEILLEDQASLERVKAGTQKRYVHLATHGILNTEDPNLSYLVLGGGDKLDIAEIAGLELDRVRMVTLSACETALGENPTSQGELTTLADAFSFAGCPTVTASLWKVSDDSTKQLMEEYYGQLKRGASPARAIQHAQNSLIENKETRHPYHWAAFLLIGDWR